MTTPEGMPRVPILERWEVGFSEERMREYGRLCYEAGRAEERARRARATEGKEAADRIEALSADTARLDSGCIVIRSRDEFGEPQAIEHLGIDLRAAIDDAIRSRNAKRRFRGGADDDGR